jgi:hypothetical protein
VPVQVTDRTKQFLDRFDNARRLGVTAAGEMLKREVRKAFGSDYYLGGKYRETIGVRKSIRRSTATRGLEGYEVRVGSKHMVALYWELGFTHAKNGKTYRVEIWKPTLLENLRALRAEFATVVKRYTTGEA